MGVRLQPRLKEQRMRILLVEDDRMIGESVFDGLRAENHAADWEMNAKGADLALRTGPYDLVLLDLGLPDRDGLSLLRDLRTRRNRTPVLIATARDAVADRIAGLDAGADDYVIKPLPPPPLRHGRAAGAHARADPAQRRPRGTGLRACRRQH